MKPLNTQHISRQEIEIFQTLLLHWFATNGRHHFPWRTSGIEDFQIVIAEILLQRTKAETIDRFFQNFILKYPTWTIIAQSDISELENSLRPIGLFRQRAKRLKDLAVTMLTLEEKLPKDRKKLEEIPFLGQYIANAIELLIFNRPSPLLDVNMSRVLERYFGERKLADIRYDPYLQELSSRVVTHPNSKEINWAILDFAASVCQARSPKCHICILSNTCSFNKKAVS